MTLVKASGVVAVGLGEVTQCPRTNGEERNET